jgi:FdhD protein
MMTNKNHELDNVGHKAWPISKCIANKVQDESDFLVIEDPLEIIIKQNQGKTTKKFTLSITMRTPGDDFNLVRGFLYTEGIIETIHDISGIRYVPTKNRFDIRSSSVEVSLLETCQVDEEKLNRHFYTASSCGVCGKTAIDQLQTHFSYILKKSHPLLDSKLITSGRNKIFEAQDEFQKTGGIHAAALFDADGNLLVLKEDVGRHNAFDKLIGEMLFQDKIPLLDNIVMVSGRASFELVQKSISAGIPIFLAIGAPSSLAVELADEYGQTLVGFIKQDSFNIYTYPERIQVKH